MSDPRTARHLAERAIRSTVEDIEYGDVGDLAEDLFDELGEAAYDTLCREAHDLISKAVVTVTWPGDDERHVVTREVLIDAISRIEIRRIKPEGGVILVAAETFADAIPAVVGETE